MKGKGLGGTHALLAKPNGICTEPSILRSKSAGWHDVRLDVIRFQLRTKQIRTQASRTPSLGFLFM